MAERLNKAIFALSGALFAHVPAASAQLMSSDGSFWYEVEVTLFSSLYPERPYAEIPVPERSNLRYLPQLRLLQNPGDSYRVVFPAPESLLPPANPSLPFAAALSADEVVAEEPEVVLEGPEFSPAVAGSFKIADYARDPFIALDRRAWRFADINNRLQNSGEHRVLWHKVWRQPLRQRAQSAALQVQGGDQFGDHYQLEGSLRFSGQGSNVDIDINVWLSTFVREAPGPEPEWRLPEMPVLAPVLTPAVVPGEPPLVTPVPAVVWYPQKIWQLNQTRSLGTNTLYYLDHPAMGALVEIRPYELPPLELPLTEGSPATNSGFE